MMDYAEIEQQALQLPALQMASLITRLSISLNEVSDTEYDRLCLEEAARRDQELEEGKVIGIPMERAFEEIRQSLKSIK